MNKNARIMNGQKPMFKQCKECGQDIGGSVWLANRLMTELNENLTGRKLLRDLMMDFERKMPKSSHSLFEACDFLGHPKKEYENKCYCGVKRRYK